MGVFALKGYIGVIAAHIAAAGWNDLLDHYQNFFVPICHLDPKIRLKKISELPLMLMLGWEKNATTYEALLTIKVTHWFPSLAWMTW